MKGKEGLAILLLFCGCTAMEITINTVKPMYQVSRNYLTVTMDTLVLNTTGKLQKVVSNERVRTLAKALGPTYLRVGGTSANYLYFCETRETCNPPDGSVIITGQDWIDLNEFVKATSLKLNFDLNALIRNPDDSWNSSNSQELLRFSQANNISSPDWQIGNELNLNNALAGNLLAKDYIQLRQILDSMGGSYAKSLLVGPEVSGMYSTEKDSFVGRFLEENPPVNAVTTHHYYFDGRAVKLKNYIDPSILDSLPTLIEKFKVFVHSIKPDVPIWISETSAGYNVGTPGVSERFAAGFLWLDKLGVAAASGVPLVGRQSLVFCSTYCLINETFDPIPDYWLSLLYRRLVGQKVLQVSKSVCDSTIRIYAHCTRRDNSGYNPGSVTVYGLNMKNRSETVLLKEEFLRSSVDQYMLTASDHGNLLSWYPELNGNRLELIEDNKLPPLEPVQQDAGPVLKFPPYSLAFFVFPEINASACLGKSNMSEQ